MSNATRWICNTANGLIPVSSLSYVIGRMSAVMKKTVVDMFNYSHPGDHTRRTINGLVFGGPKFSSLVLVNITLISLQSVGFFNNVLVLFTIFVSLFIVYLLYKAEQNTLKRNYVQKEKLLSVPPHRVDPVWHLALRWNVPKGLATSTALCYLES